MWNSLGLSSPVAMVIRNPANSCGAMNVTALASSLTAWGTLLRTSRIFSFCANCSIVSMNDCTLMCLNWMTRGLGGAGRCPGLRSPGDRSPGDLLGGAGRL